MVGVESGIASQADLAGKNIGVQKDSSALAAINSEDNADLLASFGSVTEYSDYNVALMDLEAGAVDAIAMDIGVAGYQLEQLSLQGKAFLILNDYLATEQYGIGFLKGNEELKNIVEQELLKLVDDGTYAELAEKYGLTDSVSLVKIEQ
jgi:polar amino acid transport system substrate-binding protein